MTQARRVVHVIPGMASGGAERQIEHLVLAGTTDASVVCLYLLGDVGAELRAKGATVDLLGMEGVAKVTAVVRLAALLRRARPDLVHVHLLSGQLFGVAAARLAGLPVVSTEHSLMDDEIEGRPLTPILTSTYRRLEAMTDRTIAVSPTTSRRLVGLGVEPSHIVQVDNGIDLDAFAFDPTARAAVRYELGLAPDAKVVVSVGRLDPVKRLEPLIDALTPRLLADPGTHLLLLGAGHRRQALEAQALDAGVGRQVHFLGARPDVARVLSASDVLVSPSRHETFGLAVIEGLANGLPVVYAECPALDDAQVPSWALALDGALDSDGERRAIANAVDTAMAHPQRHHVPPVLATRYGLQHFVTATEQVYADVLSVPRSRSLLRRSAWLTGSRNRS